MGNRRADNGIGLRGRGMGNGMPRRRRMRKLMEAGIIEPGCSYRANQIKNK